MALRTASVATSRKEIVVGGAMPLEMLGFLYASCRWANQHVLAKTTVLLPEQYKPRRIMLDT